MIITQKEIAELFGVTDTFISSIRHGNRKVTHAMAERMHQFDPSKSKEYWINCDFKEYKRFIEDNYDKLLFTNDI